MKSTGQSWVSIAMAVLLFFIVSAVFWPVITYDFVRWDDDINVTENGLLTEPWSWGLAAKFFDPQVALRFKPLHWVVFRIVAGTAGMNPAVWHGLGLVFHACAAVAIFAVFRVVLKRIHDFRSGTSVDVFAWLGATIWAVHPLRVEPVAWVTGSTYPMTGMFLAGSFWAYVKAHEEEHRWRWLAVAWVLAVAAYATYPTSVTYVAWLIAADFFLLRIAPVKPWKLTEDGVCRWWGKHALFAVPAAGAVAFTLWTRLFAPGRWGAAPSVDAVGWDERALAAWASLSAFIVKVICPVHLTPNQPAIPESVWFTGWVLVLATVTGCVTLTVWWLWRRGRKAPGWLCLGFGGLALPCLGLTESPTWPVDRYSYALDMVLIGAGTVGLEFLAARSRSARVMVLLGMAVVVVVVAVESRRVLPVWRDTDALFAHMEKQPDFVLNVRQQSHVYKMWAGHLMIEGHEKLAGAKLIQAKESYLSAMRRALGRGDYDEAVELSYSMQANLGITPEIRRERAAWLLRLGRARECLAELKLVEQALPGDPRVKELGGEARKLAGVE